MYLGIPGQVIGIKDPKLQIGTVSVNGVRRDVNLTCVREANEPLDALVGEWVLEHAGFAMSRLNAAEAERTLALFEELNQLHPDPEKRVEA